MRPPDVLTGLCSDGLCESCPGHMFGAPCICDCHKESRAMAAPKKPTDHLAKAEKAKVEKTDTGWTVTLRGITVGIEAEVFDDFELLDEISAVEEGRGNRLPALLRRFVGEEQFRAVLDGLRDEDTGRVPVESAAEFLGEVIQAVSPN